MQLNPMCDSYTTWRCQKKYGVNYAARFYASIADGQSIGAAHELATTLLEMMGLPGHQLPQLYAADDLDPLNVRLVLPA